jgi:uncharacterized protein YifN (PemK superfamily)
MVLTIHTHYFPNIINQLAFNNEHGVCSEFLYTNYDRWISAHEILTISFKKLRTYNNKNTLKWVLTTKFLTFNIAIQDVLNNRIYEIINIFK